MDDIQDAVDRAATASGFSGVVRVDRGGATFAQAYGMADRRHGIPMATDSQLALASGGKGFTALAIMSLVVEGRLALDTRARAVLGDDLPLIADDVTIEHLLAHTSGIGDYLDEEAEGDVEEYVLGASAHEFATTQRFLPLLDGHPTKFRAGERFSYCNGGYVVLALIAERVAGAGYHDLVRERVIEPAGLADTGFLRSDDLPGRAALGYLADGRTNVFHLPVLGNGDGGIYSTVADLRRFWLALVDGEIMPRDAVDVMTRRRTAEYGLGFWCKDGEVSLVGEDAGVSFASRYRTASGDSETVISNTSEGAWPVFKALSTALSEG